ncbi:MAG: hypothetical protein COA49_02710 [Bacteroidetes bacterium]|nr:MAG: hypothetical protein COA49_02710 [Bacteroidota bacterium]
MIRSNITLLFLSVLAFFFISTSSFQAKAQTLVAPVFISGDSYTLGITELVDEGEPGENMVWDYSGVITPGGYEIVILPSSPSPFEDDYPEANWIMEIGAANQSIYVNFGPDYLEYLGGVEQGISYPLTNSEIFFPYPFTYGETWIDDMSGTLNAAGMIINRSGIVESTVDGYGSLSLPGGIQLNDVTRVKTHREITDSTIIGVDTYVIDQIRFYQGTMLAPLVSHANIQIISPLDTTVINYCELLQTYTVGIDNIVTQDERLDFGMFPNPATSRVQVVTPSFEYGGSSINIIEVRDIAGRLVETISPISGMNVSVFDVSSWTSGVYNVTVNPGEQNSSTKQLLVE